MTLPKWYDLEFVKNNGGYLLPMDNGNWLLVRDCGTALLNAGGFVVETTGESKTLISSSRQFGLFKHYPNHVLVIGAGGVGFWFVLSLIMASPSAVISVFDFDTVEASNIERIPYPKSYIGDAKVDALVNFIRCVKGQETVDRIIPVCREFRPELLNREIDKDIDIIIDCTDKYEVQYETMKVANAKGIPYLKLGTVKNSYMISDTVPDPAFDTGIVEYEENARCGNGIPQNVLTGMACAAEGVSFVLNSGNLERTLSVNP